MIGKEQSSVGRALTGEARRRDSRQAFVLLMGLRLIEEFKERRGQERRAM